MEFRLRTCGSEGEDALQKEEKPDLLESINMTLKEILKWTRFANLPRLKDVLGQTLDTDAKKIAYDATDGLNGTKEVATASATPQDTVYGWWQQWYRLGIVTESETRQGRMVKIVSLEDVGIKAPKTPKKPSPQDNQVTPASEPSQAQEGTAEQLTPKEKDA